MTQTNKLIDIFCDGEKGIEELRPNVSWISNWEEFTEGKIEPIKKILDIFWNHQKPNLQQYNTRQTLALVEKMIAEIEGEKIKYEMGKPFCIHCRRSNDDYFNSGISTALIPFYELRDELKKRL